MGLRSTQHPIEKVSHTLFGLKGVEAKLFTYAYLLLLMLN
jgi:hypothetical protein